MFDEGTDPGLLAALDDAEPRVRLEAVRALGGVGLAERERSGTAARHRELLAGALSDPAPAVRAAAMEALGCVLDAALVPTLVGALADLDDSVATAAGASLAGFVAAGLPGLADEDLPLLATRVYEAVRTGGYETAARSEGDATDEAVRRLTLAWGGPAAAEAHGVPAAVADAARLFNERWLLGLGAGWGSDAVRGRLGEPYCSEDCLGEGARLVSDATLEGRQGSCRMCGRPVAASMYGRPDGALFPLDGTVGFACTRCLPQARTMLENRDRCCTCGVPV